MADKVIITKSKLNALGANMRRTHGLDHNPTIDEMAALALVSTGGSGGIEIPSVSNVAVSEDGILTFDEPVINGLNDYELSYIINVNGDVINTTETTLNIFSYLFGGENVISIICKVTFIDGENNAIVQFSKELVYNITISDTVLPYSLRQASCVAIDGRHIFIIAGVSGSWTNKYNIIYYDALTNSIETLAPTISSSYSADGVSAVALGQYIYIFGGGITVIQRYDVLSNSITTLEETLPYKITGASAVVINNKIYIFGGYDSGFINKILCYDPFATTNKITTLSITLPTPMYVCSAVAIGGKAYIFGGSSSSGYLKDILCFDATVNPPTITKKNAKLPNALGYSTATVLYNKAYIFGGWAGGASYYNTAQCYDPETDTLTTLDVSLTHGGRTPSSASIGTKVYIFGGTNSGKNDGLAGGTTVNTISIMTTE
jgi:N-acetylneuraminic acid mutarotase